MRRANSRSPRLPIFETVNVLAIGCGMQGKYPAKRAGVIICLQRPKNLDAFSDDSLVNGPAGCCIRNLTRSLLATKGIEQIWACSRGTIPAISELYAS